MVMKGRKLILKFECFQSEDEGKLRGVVVEDMIPCRCGDGVCLVERQLLLRQPFFERLVAFEGSREEMKLAGLSVSECRALRLFLLGDASLAETPEDLASAHEVLRYISAPEANLTLSEFSSLCAKKVVATGDRRIARRLAALDGDEYVFLGVMHSWSIEVRDVWGLCLDICKTEAFTSDICIVSSGGVVLTTRPGQPGNWGKDHGFVDVPEVNRGVRIYDPDLTSLFRDTFEAMDALLESQDFFYSVDFWKTTDSSADSNLGKQGGGLSRESSRPPVILSVADGAKLARLLVRRTTREAFKKILESCMGMARFHRDMHGDGDACNGRSESFFTTTQYESRVYEFEWVLVQRGFLDLTGGCLSSRRSIA
jgi:hypothetical protein